MTEVSIILTRLIDAAERVVCCRPPNLDEVVAEATDLHLRSPVGIVISHAPDLLMRGLYAAADRRYETEWRMIVGALLPMVRADLSRVVEARRRPLEPDTASQFRGNRG